MATYFKTLDSPSFSYNPFLRASNLKSTTFNNGSNYNLEILLPPSEKLFSDENIFTQLIYQFLHRDSSCFTNQLILSASLFVQQTMKQ